MQQWIVSHEAVIRLSFFVSIFTIMALWELLAPRRRLKYSKAVRWYSNIGITLLNTIILRYVFPLVVAGLATGMAIIAYDLGWGLFNYLDWPFGLEFVLSILLLDVAIYIQHIVFHRVPLFWRFHRMHHTDTDLDVTSGARFHPIEMIFSMGIKLGLVILIGPQAVAVIIFEVLLNVCAMFNHANVRLPEKVDKLIRMLLVTPDMHRVHHSTVKSETDSNFGFSLSLWDKVFSTYCAQPEKGHDGMSIGLDIYRAPENLHLHRLLVQPFKKEPEAPE